jgi:hypothetical protein
MIFCSFCGRQHDGTACPPQKYYQVNPISDHLKIEDLLAIIRSQSNHIITLENLLKEKENVTKIVEVPIETNLEKVDLLRDLLSFILSKEIQSEDIDSLKLASNDAIKSIADMRSAIQFIKSAAQRIT